MTSRREPRTRDDLHVQWSSLAPVSSTLSGRAQPHVSCLLQACERVRLHARRESCRYATSTRSYVPVTLDDHAFATLGPLGRYPRRAARSLRIHYARHRVWPRARTDATVAVCCTQLSQRESGPSMVPGPRQGFWRLATTLVNGMTSSSMPCVIRTATSPVHIPYGPEPATTRRRARRRRAGTQGVSSWRRSWPLTFPRQRQWRIRDELHRRALDERHGDHCELHWEQRGQSGGTSRWPSPV